VSEEDDILEAAWQTVQLARHQDRPQTLDYIALALPDFLELSGDRLKGDDKAIVGGFATLGKQRIVLIGHQKGHSLKERQDRSFGMTRPEGYRKAMRLARLGEKFGLPVVTLVDTPGAFPGVQAEERGQAEAIARATEQCLAMGVPMVAAIVGEGGSGGAIALAAANRVVMFEHAVYSVISPEGCASILWRTPDKISEAAEAMKITAADLLRLGVVDRVVEEPIGGAHRDPAAAIAALAKVVGDELDGLVRQSADVLRRRRREKFLAVGALAA
jgi:acetyl-CoA carboxylase carboxyl transferase subunit alpha